MQASNYLGLNKSRIYSTNRAAVLRSIHNNGQVSQRDIVEATNLKQPTVSKIVQELSKIGIVDKVTSKREGGRGRPSEYFSLTTDLYSLAIRVARNVVVSAFVDSEGEIYKKRHYSTSGVNSARDLRELLEEIVDSRLSSRYIQQKTIVGIGVVVPGPLNVSEDKISLITDKLGWSGLDVGELQDLTELPLIVSQDADGAVVGEHIFGVAREDTGTIFVAAGRGVGAGILMNGSIVEGGQGFSGEFGHTSVKADGLPCSCGNKGCVELYSSVNSLLKYLQDKPQADEVSYDPSNLTFGDVIELTKSGNEDVVEGVKRAAYYLGVGIANMVNLFSPSLIVLGDEMVKLGPIWVDKVMETIKERSINRYCENLQVVVSDSGEDAFLEGAGALALGRFLKNPDHIIGTK